MRYVNNSMGNPSAEWLERAAIARAELESVTAEERREVMRRHASLWSELKDTLEKCSNGKCWYCESRQDRSDNHVDHFRPKARVVECEEHEGYWWLAFEWTNYRFSCTFCNSRRRDKETGLMGGKHSHFPIFNEDKRAWLPEHDIAGEDYCLLDPVKLGDAGLLWFDDGGMAVPKYTKEHSSRLFERAKISIDVYHLNLSRTLDRRKLIYNEVARLVALGDDFFQLYADGDQTVESAFLEVLRQLQAMIRRDGEYSSAAITFLRGRRDNQREWLEDLIMRVSV